jgi:hypothetical protein
LQYKGDMTLPKRQLHVRLSDEATRKFEELLSEFPALQATVVLRLLVVSALDKPKDEQIDIIVRALRGKSGAAKLPKTQRQVMNTRNRISEQ